MADRDFIARDRRVEDLDHLVVVRDHAVGPSGRGVDEGLVDDDGDVLAEIVGAGQARGARVVGIDRHGEGHRVAEAEGHRTAECEGAVDRAGGVGWGMGRRIDGGDRTQATNIPGAAGIGLQHAAAIDVEEGRLLQIDADRADRQARRTGSRQRGDQHGRAAVHRRLVDVGHVGLEPVLARKARGLGGGDNRGLKLADLGLHLLAVDAGLHGDHQPLLDVGQHVADLHH